MVGIRPFDARALTAPEDRTAARAFTARLRAEQRLPGSSSASAIVAMVAGVVILGVGGVVLTVLFVVLAASLGEGAPLLGILFLLPLLLGVGVIAGGYVAFRHGRRAQEDRRWRMAGFARDVGMEYVPAVPAPGLPGVIFGIGSGRVASDILRGHRPRFVEVGNHTYTVSNGKNTTTMRWGYIAIRLDVPLPHIVLDATANDGLFGSNLPASWGRAQQLSLEGDFDRHFRLFCPRGYERDALYLFTPDVMARFIDNASVLDVEIVDDWLLLYSGEELSSTDPARWAWVFSVISTLLEKLDQWARWRDDRLAAGAPGAALWAGAPGVGLPASAPGAAVPAGAGVSAGSNGAGVPAAPLQPRVRPPVGVAPPGRRLRGRSPWIVVAIVLTVFGIGGLAVTLGPFLLLLALR
ncbi:hypothetical protein [Microbacterium enclense]|uniref:DUF3137 domain-containing protein n=1 Tax=Microbacterium enclense TaxID=993073 RepID=A0A1G6J6D3_9MICO|nr:hypothetical protein [Microbacterium enclense]KSU54761.1 hypothetical protein AS029_07360 [Microbacterium enclense]SDC14422.1 hypothetical protein SAMN05216418_1728 [Microbacterium enclense]